MTYSPTFTFTAGTKAVSSEVNQNFSDINSAGFADVAATNTFSAKQSFATSTDAELNIDSGVVPTTNLVNGDMYIDSGTNRLTIRHAGVFERYALFSEIQAGDITGVTAGLGLVGGGTSGDVTLDVASANTAIVVNANDITLTLAATSGLAISTGLLLADSVAGAGLAIASKVLAVGAGTGITVNANDVALTIPVVESSGGTNQTTYATGDILFASGANTLSKLTAGSDGQHLILAAGVPTWSSEVGDISEVIAGTNLNGGGTSAVVTVNLDAALTGMTSIVISESAASLALSVSGSGTNEVMLVDGTNTSGDTAALFRGGLVSKRSTTNGQQGYALVGRGYISNELCPTNVTYTVDGTGDVTKIEEFVDSGKTILLRQVDIVYQADKNPFTVTEIGTAVSEMGLTSVVTTFTYVTGAGAGQSGDLVSMARVAS